MFSGEIQMVTLILTHLTGIYPRSENTVTITRAFDRGKASREDVDRAIQADLSNLIAVQTNAGLDLVVDGQLTWQDIFRPFSEILTGITPGTLTRWFDNNTFYRKPEVKGKITLGEKSSIDRYFRGDRLPDKQKKAILPGPFTFAYASQNEMHTKFSDLVDDFAHALGEIIVELEKRGYRCIQFNEPYLTSNTNKTDLEHAKNAYGILKRNGSKSIIQTYFNDVQNIIVNLLDFPVDCIGLDLYATPIESVNQYSFTKELNCGCIDGRNSLLESVQEIKSLVERVQIAISPKALYVSPNCDLEFLPSQIAERKTQLLRELKNQVE